MILPLIPRSIKGPVHLHGAWSRPGMTLQHEFS